MLNEDLVRGGTLSKDRLRRIEQCAVASNACTAQLENHEDTHLELFQDVAMAFDGGAAGGNLHVEFGRIQKMVTRGTGKSKKSHLRLFAVSFENLPVGLQVRCRFYEKTQGLRTYRYSIKPDVKRYEANTILAIVHFTYNQSSDTYTLCDDQYKHVMSELRRLEGVRKSKRRATRTTTTTIADNPYKRTTFRSRPDSSRRHQPQTKGRKLEVGMRVRLQHEVCTVSCLQFNCL